MKNSMIKRLTALMLTGAFIIALSGCNKDPQETGPSAVAADDGKTPAAAVDTTTTSEAQKTTVSTAEAEPAPEENTGNDKTVPVFEDGKAQPVFQITNLRDESYTNDESDILRYCVYVETDHDTDGDGKADLVKVLMQVPRAAANGDYKAATIYDPTPYGAGTVDDASEGARKFYNPTPFDYNKLYEPGEKRKASGSMTTLEAAEYADQDDWNYKVPNSKYVGFAYATWYDYYLVRGFAVAEASGIGTYGSEGYELCGWDLERDAHACVVEWLAGDRVAYTDAYNNIEIKAGWSNGNVAMTGCSYGGTMPYEVATTGVKGLKTIVPFAGIACWYDYTNSQGAPTLVDVNYADYLSAYNSGAAYLDDNWTVLNDDYASYLWQISKDQEATNGDYADIWAISDYTRDISGINCSALIVHGMNDFNVLTKQADLMARAFAEAGKPFKLILHQDGHNMLNGVCVRGEVWQETMNRWFSHYLYDIDNGIENMAEVTIQSNIDGSFREYEKWRDFKFESFVYDKDMNNEETSNVDTTLIASYDDSYSKMKDEFGNPLSRDNFYLTLPDEACAYYTYDLPDNYTVYGVPEVHIRMSTPDADLDGIMVSAMLIDTIDGETSFKAYMTKESLNDILPVKTVDKLEAGGGVAKLRIKEFVKSNTSAKLVTFGYTDLQNYGGGYDAWEYTKKDTPMKADEYYDYTIYLQPTVYTVEPGHRLVLVITGWDPYKTALDEDFNSGNISEPSNSIYTYSFRIDNSTLDFKIPYAG